MLRTVETVTAFLENSGEVLLLLRSQKVGAYQGLWGGVSGLIEKGRTTDEQVLVEIEEETGLIVAELQLVRKGEPQVIIDANRNLKKVVYPFLFHVTDRNKVRIDWEHIDLKWIRPAEINKYPTMPELRETLERVLG